MTLLQTNEQTNKRTKMSTIELLPILSVNNEDPRDQNIQFFEQGHRYHILTDPDSKYTSVTTWNHSHFPKFDADGVIAGIMKGKAWKEGHKYWGLTAAEIKQQWSNNGASVSAYGTDMHYRIECFMNNPDLEPGYTHKELYDFYERLIKRGYSPPLDAEPLEWQYFIQFVKDTPDLKPYRTEWLIYNEDFKISGSIDMVYENPDGTLAIYDWKRCKDITRVNSWNKYALTKTICHLPDSNFWHYALQLNTYKAILQDKYGKVVNDLFLVRLHPDAEENSYELIKIPDLQNEVKELLEERKSKI